MKGTNNMKNWICALIGAIGGVIASAFGGWDAAIVTLLVCMGVDYITGLMVAGIFHASQKTKTGALESGAAWKGLCRKFVTLLAVVLAHRVDMMLGVTYVRDAVVIAFSASELLSITENAGLMGVPMPKVLRKAIDVLNEKSGETEEQEGANET